LEVFLPFLFFETASEEKEFIFLEMFGRLQGGSYLVLEFFFAGKVLIISLTFFNR